MPSHWTHQVANCLVARKPSRILTQHLDALLLWLANPENPRAAELDRAIGRRHLSRDLAARCAYEILDRALFDEACENDAARLGLADDVAPGPAKQRYRRLIQVYHPDRHPGQSRWATRRSEQLNRAFAAISAGRPHAPSGKPPARPSATSDGVRRRSRHVSPTMSAAAEIAATLWIRARRLGLGTKLVVGTILATAALTATITTVWHDGTPPRPPRVIHHPIERQAHPTVPAAPVQPIGPIPAADEPIASASTPETPERTSDDRRLDSVEALPVAIVQESGASDHTGDVGSPSNIAETQSDATQRVEHAEQPSLSTATAVETPAPRREVPESAAPPALVPPASPAEDPAGSPPDESLETASPQAAVPPEPSLEERSRHDAQYRAPTLTIPPAPSPPPPESPSPPRLPIQISAATVAVPEPPAVAPVAGQCGGAEALLNRFQKTYQAGALDELMALYSPQARENDLASWFTIREAYGEWFRTTSARTISFDRLRVESMTRENRCAAMARFQVSYLDEQSLLATKAGLIQLLLEPHGGGLRILRVRY